MRQHALAILDAEKEELARLIGDARLSGLSITDSPANADIFLAHPREAVQRLANAPELKWIQTSTVGVDPLLKNSARRDYVLTNARGILGPKLTEYTFAHILAHKKRLFELKGLQERKIWDSKPASSLQGETICILGTGSIGSHLAKVAKAFGMRALGYRTKKEPVDGFDEISGPGELSLFLAKGDYVVCVLPGTADTEDVIKANTLAQMKDGAVFINIGRGNAVQEDDLLDAVRSKKISHAILDVFKREPLPEDSPFWDEPNVTVTPHMAGYADAHAVAQLFAENYRRFLAGERLRYIVDFEKGY